MGNQPSQQQPRDKVTYRNHGCRKEQAPFEGKEGSQEEDLGSFHPQGLVPSQGTFIFPNQRCRKDQARRGRPPRLESTKHRSCLLPTCSMHQARTSHSHMCRTFVQSISLSFFIGRQRTVFEAGFALNTHGSLVKGLTPLRAFVAGLFFSFMLSIPAILKEPDPM